MVLIDKEAENLVSKLSSGASKMEAGVDIGGLIRGRGRGGIETDVGGKVEGVTAGMLRMMSMPSMGLLFQALAVV